MENHIEKNIMNDVGDETISLIDILAVILRYWKIIAIFTIASVVCALLAYLLVINPQRSMSANQGRYEAQASYQIRSIPTDVESMLNLNVPLLVGAYLNSVSIASQAFGETVVSKDKNFQGVKFTDPGALEAFTKEVVLKVLLKIEISKDGVVSIAFSNDNIDVAKNFMTRLVDIVQKRIALDISPSILQAGLVLKSQEEQTLLAQQKATAIQTANSSLNQSLLLLSRQKLVLDQLQHDSNFPLLQIGDISIIDTTKSTGKLISGGMLLILSLLAGLIFSVVLAFVLDYIRRTRSNPVEMAKLRDALGKNR